MPNPASLRRSAMTKRLQAAVAPAAKVALGWVDPHRRAVDTSARPIFLCGCSHSGTTLLLRMLGQHPDVYAVPYESNIFCTPRTRHTHVASMRAWEADAAKAGRSRVCEKTPNHVFHLDRLLRFYPAARVCVLVRDGRDVAASLGKRWHGDVERAIRKWVDAIETGNRWLDDERVLAVRYEDLVRLPEETMRRVCDHVGVPFSADVVDDRPFRYAGADGTEKPETVVGEDHHRYRAWQVNQPRFDGSGRWRQSLTPEQQALCHRIAGPLLADLGYDDVTAD